MMVQYFDDRREMIRLQLKICENGFAGSYNNQLVDCRINDVAEMFDKSEVEEIINDLNDELKNIDVLEKLEEKKIAQAKIDDWKGLIEEIKTLKMEVNNIRQPYDDKINQLKIERDKLLSMSLELINIGEKKAIEKCPHIETNIEHYSIEGSYLNTGSHTRILKCTYCNIELDRDETSTGYA